MWFSLVSIKNHYLSQKFYGNSRDVVKQLFNNIFHIVNFEQLYVQDDKILINKHDKEKVNDLFKYYIEEYKTSKLTGTLLKNNAFELKTRDSDEIIKEYTLNFVKNMNYKGVKTIYNKSRKMTTHIDNLNKIYAKENVLSFDFEYRNNSKYAISEIGISLFFPKENRIESKHIIINSNNDLKSKKKKILENQFIFGESKYMYIDEALKLITTLIKKSDYIVGHDIANEFRLLNIYPNWNNIIDTKFVDIIVNDRENYCSLEFILMEYGFKAYYLHNAGNDARFTMELIIAMNKEVNKQEISVA